MVNELAVLISLDGMSQFIHKKSKYDELFLVFLSHNGKGLCTGNRTTILILEVKFLYFLQEMFTIAVFKRHYHLFQTIISVAVANHG